MTQNVDYKIIRGLPWERLILVKDGRNHRVLRPTDSSGFIKTGDSTKTEISTSITTENGIYLELTAEETQDLPLGALSYDVLATIGGIPRPVSKGIINVSALDSITNLEDTKAMEIRYRQRTDFRRNFTWKDSAGVLIAVQSAYMQAKTAAGATMVDLRWFASPPSENTIAGLPATRRGYLAPNAGTTLEMHISDQHTVAAGSYPFDLFVQDSAGDWDCLVSGTLIVEASTSSPPV